MSKTIEATVDFVYDMAHMAKEEPSIPLTGAALFGGFAVLNLVDPIITSTPDHNQISNLQHDNAAIGRLAHTAQETGNTTARVFLLHQRADNQRQLTAIRSHEPTPPSFAEYSSFLVGGGLFGAVLVLAAVARTNSRRTRSPKVQAEQA